MIEGMKVSVVLPVLNEEKGLKVMLPKMPDVIDEVILSDNGSDDSSVSVGQQYGATIINASPKGYGAALLAGIEAATGDVVLFMDADASFSVAEIPVFLEPIVCDACAFVSGKRSFLNRGFFSVFGNLCMRFFVRILYRINLMDTQSGVCAFKKDILGEIKPESKGMSFSQEIKLLAYLNPQIKTAEVPVDSLKREGEMKYRIIADSLDNLKNFVKFYFITRKTFRQ